MAGSATNGTLCTNRPRLNQKEPARSWLLEVSSLTRVNRTPGLKTSLSALSVQKLEDPLAVFIFAC